MSAHPSWCTQKSEPAEVCGDTHTGPVVFLTGRNGYSTVALGVVDGDPVVELATCDPDAIGAPVLLSLNQAEEVAAQLIAAVVRLRGTLGGFGLRGVAR